MTEPPRSQSASQDHVNQLVGLVETERRVRTAAAPVPVPAGRTRQRCVRFALAITTPVLAAIVTVSFVGPVREFLFEERLTPARAQEEAHRTLAEIVADIESFRHDYNELPQTLFEIGLPSRGTWTYTASGKSAYRVQGSLQGQHVVFDSANEGRR